ncbi:MAG: glycogen debranching N-terminal domain-containing protein [Parvibaculaceae bacterium]
MRKPVAQPAFDLHLSEEEIPEHYIEARTSLVERSLRALKHGDAFAVLDPYGDVGADGETPEGIYFRDMRYLSRFELRFEGRRPLLLGSVIQDDNAALTVDLANPDIRPDRPDGFARDIIAIDRTKFLWESVCYDRVGLRNFDQHARSFRLDFFFDADFSDLFEVRGLARAGRGERSARVEGDSDVVFEYRGLDGIVRRTRICFERPPDRLLAHRASFNLTMPARSRASLLVNVLCEEGERRRPQNFLAAYRDKRRALRAAMRGIATVESSNALFNELVRRSISDLYMLMSEKPEGLYPYAGIPWYSTVFGRDGIITAMMLLWIDPSVAAGVLRYLARNQASAFDAAADAEPGKIMHERRHGEMAHTGEVPFRRYYGTVDATPLFVMLAGRYFERTGDRALIETIWPNSLGALAWCERHGDRDGDGFVEYFRETEKGLANQGWKDSHDSIFHADGSAAGGPIALCEVQAYVYAAKRAGARLAAALGKVELAEKLDAGAEALRVAFEAAFWCEELGTYALALDGEKRPCRVRTTNAGHALFTGIASPERAARVAASLLSQEGFSGWGIRTVALGEPRYNPMSYHNGSIWPHDNAMIASGFARYGLKAAAGRVFEAIFDASLYQDQRRIPELFCGFIRKPRRGPTSYPVACSPQAWAAASPFAFLTACLGLELPHEANEVRFMQPTLPGFLDEVTIRGLKLAGSELDVKIHRHGEDVTVNVLRRVGDVGVTLRK